MQVLGTRYAVPPKLTRACREIKEFANTSGRSDMDPGLDLLCDLVSLLPRASRDDVQQELVSKMPLRASFHAGRYGPHLQRIPLEAVARKHEETSARCRRQAAAEDLVSGIEEKAKTDFSAGHFAETLNTCSKMMEGLVTVEKMDGSAATRIRKAISGFCSNPP